MGEFNFEEELGKGTMLAASDAAHRALRLDDPEPYVPHQPYEFPAVLKLIEAAVARGEFSVRVGRMHPRVKGQLITLGYFVQLGFYTNEISWR